MRRPAFALLLVIALTAHGTTLPQLGADGPLSLIAFGPALVSYNPRLATDGSGFLAVWTDGRHVLASRIDGNGRLRDIQAVSIANGFGPYDVAYANGVYDGASSVLLGDSGGALGTNPIAIAGNGSYWYDGSDGTTAQPFWSRIDTRTTPALTQSVAIGNPMPLPLAATANSTTAFVFYEGGDDDPALLAPRIYVRAFATPDPYPAPHQRAGGK